MWFLFASLKIFSYPKMGSLENIFPLTIILIIIRAAITSLFLRFVLILKVCVLENSFVLIFKICPYFDLCPYFCFVLMVEVLTPST